MNCWHCHKKAFYDVYNHGLCEEHLKDANVKECGNCKEPTEKFYDLYGLNNKALFMCLDCFKKYTRIEV